MNLRGPLRNERERKGEREAGREKEGKENKGRKLPSRLILVKALSPILEDDGRSMNV